MDSIYISDLEVSTKIGITEEERSSTQRVHISVELFFDTSTVAASDDVSDTIDYEAVANKIKELAEIERNTVERFAEDIATMILSDFNPASVKVSIKKFILPDTNHVSITITRPT